jgi:hypothetical protein
MRTALLCGLLVAVLFAALQLPRLLSNADFIYMCVGAAMLVDGKLPASPYFPPGYTALVWCLMQLGLNALTAGAVLSAIGMGLVSGAVAYVARLWAMPPAPALLLGILTSTLPSLLIVGLNPHLDALYAGLGAVLLAAAMRAFRSSPGWSTYASGLLCCVVLVSLRYHAALVVLPIALVLGCSRASGVRAFGVTLLIIGSATIGATLYALQLVTGSTATAGLTQVRTGATYRELQDEHRISAAIFDDYATWLATWPQADARMIGAGIAANWPSYITRKAIIGGALLWLLGWAIRRREQPGALWLLLFILGYTLAISPTYYISRASALPEAAGMMLAAAGLGTLFFTPTQGQGRRRKQQFVPDPAVSGAVIFLLALAGIAYNGWRELPILAEQRRRAVLVREVNARALEVVGGHRRQLYGAMHYGGVYGSGRFNLPGTTWSRLWMDDPAVAPLVAPYLPKSALQDVIAGRGSVTAVLIWTSDYSRPSVTAAEALAKSPVWEEVPLNTDEARLWRRRLAGD